MHIRTPRMIWFVLLVVGLLLSSCSARAVPALTPASPEPTTKQSPTPVPEPTRSVFSAPTAVTTPTAPSIQNGDTIVIHADGPPQPIDPRLLGTNVPAWLNPDRLNNPDFRARTRALGTTLLRMPGGSWSNYYDWMACETGDSQLCEWPSAARPTDFLNFARAVDADIMWTVSMNGTSKEAAAAVAFFNGKVDDNRPIGVDIRGRDWKTVGYWAQLRAKNGNPEPASIKLWEVGNEAYGAKQSTGGSQCAPWGWEEVWTCDGAEYIQGKGDGAERHEGFLEFRSAMRAVDPTIQVGAVGVDDPASWSAWGQDVMTEAGDNLDFYVVHLYGFWEQPPGTREVLAKPAPLLEQMATRVRAGFKKYGNGRDIPIAVTEYNLVSGQDLDNDQYMKRAVNAFYMAETVGEMARLGIPIANSWNLANGAAPNGTDYGMIDSDSFQPRPQYYAFWLWGRFGNAMLPVDLPQTTPLRVYAGKTADGATTLFVINKSDKPVTIRVRLEGAPGVTNGTLDAVVAASLQAEDLKINGVSDPGNDFADAPPQPISLEGGSIEMTFLPFSLSLARFPAQP